MKDILLFSGGLDSLIAWYYLEKPECLYVDLRHKYNRAEHVAIDLIKQRTGMLVHKDYRLDLGGVEQPDAFIPMRNTFLAQIGSFYGEHIWIISQKGEMNIADRSNKFYDDTSDYLSFLNGKHIIIDTPFRKLTKTDMVEWYLGQGHPIDILKLSISCYNGNRCGECPSCFRRWVSFELNGIYEDYKVDPWTTPLAKEYLNKVYLGLYEPDRSGEIINALEKRGLKL